ncbi:MAG: hypothetical protein WCT04_06950 [Planctomycetota bacterium]
MRRLFILSLIATLSFAMFAEDDAARRISARFDAAKPDAKRLAFFSLDWCMNLKDAKERAAKEHRPILVILNTNITAGTNFFSGHT